jgi:cytochrome c-type biogenesis protein CcmH
LKGEPSRLVARALTLDPNHPKALSLAATAALERKDYAGAIAQWQKLKAQFAPGGEEAKAIDGMIAEAEAAQRGTPAAAGNATSSPSKGDVADVSAIAGRVSLDPKLRERVSANDVLFIFARAANGPRMPLAVLRTTAGDLPRDFKLDDSMAMTPAARLSNAGDVIIQARIAKSGSATPAAGDLQGASAPVRPGTRDVLIVIKDVVR